MKSQWLDSNRITHRLVCTLKEYETLKGSESSVTDLQILCASITYPNQEACFHISKRTRFAFPQGLKNSVKSNC